MFRDYLTASTHWGWTDLDCFFGDMSPLLKALDDYDVVTYPDGVCAISSDHVEK